MAEGGSSPLPAPKFNWQEVANLRVLVVLMLFALLSEILWMIGHDQQLRDDAAFMTIAGNLAGGGGFGLMIAYLFGGTKSGGETMQAQTAALASAATTQSPQPVTEGETK